MRVCGALPANMLQVISKSFAPLLLSLAALGVSSSHVAPTPPTFDVEDANRTLHLAWTAFCNESAVTAWNCQWCSGPNTYPPLEVVTYLKDHKAGTQGYVAIDYPRKRVVVAYRGSKNLANGIEDAEFLMSKLPFGPGGLKVDHGARRACEAREALAHAADTLA